VRRGGGGLSEVEWGYGGRGGVGSRRSERASPKSMKAGGRGREHYVTRALIYKRRLEKRINPIICNASSLREG
jgi:hypothetical protein